MTNPDWRPIETVTPEMYAEGDWYWRSINTRDSASPKGRGFNSFKDFASGNQVYGPIPDPPKPPPKLRRFTGVSVTGKVISGVKILNGNREHVLAAWADKMSMFHIKESSVKNLVWLDPE